MRACSWSPRPSSTAAAARCMKLIDGTDIVTSSWTMALIDAAAWPTPMLKISTRASFSSSLRLNMSARHFQARHQLGGPFARGALHIGRQQRDAQRRQQAAQLLGGGDTAHAGHVHVHQHEVRRERLDALDGVLAGAGFLDDPVGVLALDVLARHQTRDAAVVDDQDGGGGGHGLSCGSMTMSHFRTLGGATGKEAG